MIASWGGEFALAAASASDDRGIVEDGAQYFVDGIVGNFASFDVDSGGIAIMGALSAIRTGRVMALTRKRVFEAYAMRIEPVPALSFAALETDAYRERGTAGGNLLMVDQADHQSLKSMLGARVALPIELESGRKIVPDARVMWGHEYLDDHATFSAALSSSPNVPFVVRGQEFARDSLIVGSGVTVPLMADAVLYADYDVSLSPDQTVQTLSIGGRWSW